MDKLYYLDIHIEDEEGHPEMLGCWLMRVIGTVPSWDADAYTGKVTFNVCLTLAEVRKLIEYDKGCGLKCDADIYPEDPASLNVLKVWSGKAEPGEE